MPKLAYLEIDNADITDDGIQQLKSLKSAQLIRFFRCKRLTRKGIERLKTALPRASTAVLAIGVVTALSFSPLPSWWSLLPEVMSATDIGTPSGTNATLEEYAGTRTSPHNSAERSRNDAVNGRIALPIRLLRLFQQTGDIASVEESTATRTWSRSQLELDGGS